jgi:hypothetical protein
MSYFRGYPVRLALPWMPNHVRFGTQEEIWFVVGFGVLRKTSKVKKVCVAELIIGHVIRTAVAKVGPVCGDSLGAQGKKKESNSMVLTYLARLGKRGNRKRKKPGSHDSEYN